MKKNYKIKNTLRVQKLQSKRRLAHHNTTVANESGRRQALGESVGHHFVCTKRDEFDIPSLYEFAHKISTNVNVSRKFPTNSDTARGRTLCQD